MAPDINSFHSSKHHNHFRIRHSYLAEGGEFYIIVKTTSRSGIDGYQVGLFILIDLSQLLRGQCLNILYKHITDILNLNHLEF